MPGCVGPGCGRGPLLHNALGGELSAPSPHRLPVGQKGDYPDTPEPASSRWVCFSLKWDSSTGNEAVCQESLRQRSCSSLLKGTGYKRVCSSYRCWHQGPDMLFGGAAGYHSEPGTCPFLHPTRRHAARPIPALWLALLYPGDSHKAASHW